MNYDWQAVACWLFVISKGKKLPTESNKLLIMNCELKDSV